MKTRKDPDECALESSMGAFKYPVIAISQVAPDASHAGQFLVLLALVVFPILLLLVEIL